jgi:hypothetical protein
MIMQIESVKQAVKAPATAMVGSPANSIDSALCACSGSRLCHLLVTLCISFVMLLCDTNLVYIIMHNSNVFCLTSLSDYVSTHDLQHCLCRYFF